jgi:hypothetical protein
MTTTFTDLPEADQTQLLARLKVYGLDQTAITHPDLVVPGGSTVRLAAGDPQSAVQARMLTTKNLDELKQWIGIPDELYTTGRLDQKRILMPPALTPPATGKPELAQVGVQSSAATADAERLANVRLATSAYLFGNSAEVSGYASEISTVFPEFQVPIWNFYTITVNAGATLELSGAQNILSAWKIVIYEGGTIAASGGLKTDTVQLEKVGNQIVVHPFPIGPVHVAPITEAQT